MTGMIDFESHGLSTMALTFLTMKSLIWLLCLATSLSPLTTIVSYPCRLPSAVMLSPMTLKKGFSSVKSETPIVCFAAGEVDVFTADEPDGVTALSPLPQPSARTTGLASKIQSACFMVVSSLGGHRD